MSTNNALVAACTCTLHESDGLKRGAKIHKHVMGCCSLQDLTLDPERPEYHRATVHYGYAPGQDSGDMGYFAVSTGNQISSRLLSARSANVLLELPQAEGFLSSGNQVSALIIDDLQKMPVPNIVNVRQWLP